MKPEINTRVPQLEEIFKTTKTDTPAAPGNTNWTPILLTAGALIIGGIVIYIVVDHVTEKQNELMLAEIRRNRTEQQVALKAQLAKLDQIHASSTELTEDHRDFVDTIMDRVDQLESGLTKPGPPAFPGEPNKDPDSDI